MPSKVVPTKHCAVCGALFAKSPSNSKAVWEKRKCCSYRCSVEIRRGRPNPKAAYWKGKTQPPETRAKRSESLKRAHAEGRMHVIDNAGLRGEQTSQWKGDAVGYRAMHARLVKARGKASEYQCVDCDRPARDWSHDGGKNAFSTDLSDYSSRCRRCHLVYDERERDSLGRLT